MLKFQKSLWTKSLSSFLAFVLFASAPLMWVGCGEDNNISTQKQFDKLLQISDRVLDRSKKLSRLDFQKRIDTATQLTNGLEGKSNKIDTDELANLTNDLITEAEFNEIREIIRPIVQENPEMQNMSEIELKNVISDHFNSDEAEQGKTGKRPCREACRRAFAIDVAGIVAVELIAIGFCGFSGPGIPLCVGAAMAARTVAVITEAAQLANCLSSCKY